MKTEGKIFDLNDHKSKGNWLAFLKWKEDNCISEIDLMERPITKKEFEALIGEHHLSVSEIKARILEMEAFQALLRTYVNCAVTIQHWPSYTNIKHKH
jgi:hypothetical protein